MLQHWPEWSVTQLTAAINQVPYVPGIIGTLNLFDPRPGSLTTATIERQGNSLALVPAVPRGAPPSANIEGGRDILDLRIPHFPINDTILADEVQDVRAFGRMDLQSFPVVVQQRLNSLGRKLDATLEHLRLGAVRGQVITRVNRDTGAPELSVNLFDAFGVVAPSTVGFEFSTVGGSEWLGLVTTTINGIIQTMEDELGASPPGVVALCGTSFWNALMVTAEVRDAVRYADASLLVGNASGGPIANPQPRPQSFQYRGVTFIRYAGRVGAYQFLDPATAQFIPVGVPDLFVEAYAPADYIETVNTPGLPRYAKQEPLDFGRGAMLEAQMNVLPICTQPRCLIKATFSMETPNEPTP